MKFLVGTCFLVDHVFVLVRSDFFGLGVDLRGEGTLFEPLIDIFLLFLDNFLYFIFHPEVVSFQKSRMTGHKIPLIVFDDRLEGTLDIDLMFGKLMFFHKVLLGFPALIVKILPDRF